MESSRTTFSPFVAMTRRTVPTSFSASSGLNFTFLPSTSSFGVIPRLPRNSRAFSQVIHPLRVYIQRSSFGTVVLDWNEIRITHL